MASNALTSAVLRLLRPLIRILVRHGVSFGEFRDLARQSYVQVASTDFQLAGRKQTISRIAMLTGIQRKEVARLLSDTTTPEDPMDARHNRGTRVISGWTRDSEFLTPSGEPAELPFDGASGSFSNLVKRYSGDLPARAVLDELERVGSVARNDEDRIQLVSIPGYVPAGDLEAQFNILGTSTADLLGTLDHNLENDTTRLQLTTAYDNLPKDAVEAFRRLSSEQGQALLKRMDTWLAEHDRDTNPGLTPDDGRYRAGIGIYYIEEQVEDLES